MIPFYKMHAHGNDFVIIESLHHSISLPHPIVIQKWADRHTGVGFDQLLYLSTAEENKKADVVCRIFNASGREAEQCGHGMACLAQWLYQYGGLQKSTYHIATVAGLCAVQRVDEGRAIVNLGIPTLKPADIPFLADNFHIVYSLPLPMGLAADPKIHRPIIQQPQCDLRASSALQASSKDSIWAGVLGIGNPHCVIPVKNVDAVSMDIAQALSKAAQFPNCTNVEFMEVINSARIKVRVYERGVGENRACGTGACASMIVGRLLGYLRPIVQVEFSLGSVVVVHWNRPKTKVLLHTDTHFVFQGVLSVPR